MGGKLNINDLKIDSKARYEQIADKLENIILNDRSKVEKKLPSEPFLAEAFGVSRPVIREAVKLLKERGLIKSRQGASTIITKPDTDTLAKNINRIVISESIKPSEIYQMRILLETYSASLAALNRTDENIKRMKMLNEKFVLKDFTPAELAEFDIAFHTEIANTSDNMLLKAILSSVSVILKPILVEIYESEKIDEHGYKIHKKIISAIENGDVEEASEIMRAHLLLSARNYEFVKEKEHENI